MPPARSWITHTRLSAEGPAAALSIRWLATTADELLHFACNIAHAAWRRRSAGRWRWVRCLRNAAARRRSYSAAPCLPFHGSSRPQAAQAGVYVCLGAL